MHSTLFNKLAQLMRVTGEMEFLAARFFEIELTSTRRSRKIERVLHFISPQKKTCGRARSIFARFSRFEVFKSILFRGGLS